MKTHRKCRKCGKIKPVEEFHYRAYVRKDGTRGRDNVCKKCRSESAATYYKENREKVTLNHEEYRKKNPEKRRADNRKWYKKNREHIRAQGRKWDRENRFAAALHSSRSDAKRRGYQPCNATKEELALAFTGYCAACGKSEEENGMRLALDHCHRTGAARGFLCNKCNLALGMLGDSAETLRALADLVEGLN